MKNVNLADAKAHLSELVEKAAAGDSVQILRRGKPIAQITAVKAPRLGIDPKTLQSVTDLMPRQSESAGDLVRRMRDEDRF